MLTSQTSLGSNYLWGPIYLIGSAPIFKCNSADPPEI